MKISRRNFVASLGGLSLASIATSVPTVAIAGETDYRALVCINLAGGNDAVNTIVPTDDNHYDEYKAVRPSIAVSKSTIVEIPQTVLDNHGQPVTLGLHPKLAPLKPLFEDGNATVIINSGILKEPLSKSDIESQLKPLPPQLFSHNSQTSEWERGAAGSSLQLGWAGRMFDVLESNTSIAPLFSISGNTLLLRSADHSQNVLKQNGSIKLSGLSNEHMESNYQKISEADSDNPFIAQMRSVMGDAMHVSQALAAQIDKISDWPEFSSSNLGKQFQIAYKLIVSQSQLGQSRQVFYLKQTGYDVHDDQLKKHPLLLADLAKNVAAFNNALSHHGLSDAVTSFTTSEFGRRLASNGNGTDHGWGGHQFVFGGAVNGNQGIGVWPQLQVDGDDDISKGRLIPTLASDQVHATLARWMGVQHPEELRYVFPHIDNFASNNLGFMT
ncbi:DUF1501 domain-containing protein [Vibrio paucivorans]